MINVRVEILSGHNRSKSRVRIIDRHIADNRSTRLFSLIMCVGML